MLISLMALKSLVVNTVAAKEYIAREVKTVQISSRLHTIGRVSKNSIIC